MSGRVCSVHNEYCPDGYCRWCEPLDPVAVPAHQRSVVFDTMCSLWGFSAQQRLQAEARGVSRSPLSCPHENLSATQDICADCGLIGARPTTGQKSYAEMRAAQRARNAASSWRPMSEWAAFCAEYIAQQQAGGQ